MAMVRIYPHCVSVNSSYYSGIDGYEVNGNVQRSAEIHDGKVDPSYVATLEHKPDFTVRTKGVATLLAAIGFGGIALTDLTVHWKRGVSGGTRASGSVHAKTVATSGVAVMRPLRASHNQVVTAEFQAFLLSSTGLADPLTWTFSQALAGTIADVAHFTLGPVYVTPSGGSRTQIEVSEWELDPGIQIEPESSDGLPFPTYAGISERKPRAMFKTMDVNHLNTVNMNGRIGSVELFLRKLAEGGAGGRVANATEEHIKITIADGLILTDRAAAELSGQSAFDMAIDATRDGTNPIVDIDFDVAIA